MPIERVRAAIPDARVFVVAFVTAAVVFLLLDAVWLTTMASRLYRPAIGHVMREDFDALAAVAFYAIYLTGLVAFVVRPATSARMALARLSPRYIPIRPPISDAMRPSKRMRAPT